MSTPRLGHTATLLQSGQVLITGGYSNESQTPLATAEIYDPVAGAFFATDSMNFARANHTATLLSDGRVLINGGATLLPAEIYSPGGNGFGSFSITGTPKDGTSGTTAALLANGQVLVAGGQTARTIGPSSTAEVYDPASGTFGPLISMEARIGDTETLLPNGKVLIAGGGYFFDGCCGTLSDAEVFDPMTNSFEPPITMVLSRSGHTATLLGNGKVLIVGGIFGPFIGPFGLQSPAEFYDPSLDQFTPASSGPYVGGLLQLPRYNHTASLLNDGRVLIAGGLDETYAPLGPAEVFSSEESFSLAGSMLTARSGHTATSLNNGLVLIAGGQATDGSILSSAELYIPVPPPP